MNRFKSTQAFPNMLVEAFSAMLYGAVFLSLIVIDYILGHGFVDMFQKIFCKVACFVKKAVREEAKHAHINAENPISLPVLFMEILVLSLTIAVRFKIIYLYFLFCLFRCAQFNTQLQI